MTIIASAAGVLAAVTRQCSLTTAMQLITALSSVNNASRYSDQTLSGAAKMDRIKFSYSGSERTPRNTTGPMYNKKLPKFGSLPTNDVT